MPGLLALAEPVVAQIHVDALTEARHIRFAGVHALPEHRLAALIRTRGRGASYGLRVALGKIPLVPGPGPQPFSPLTLQEDVVRLRGAYAAAGYFRAKVRYDVKRDDAKNLLDITFVIDEGEPTLLADVTVTALDSLTALPIPAGEEKSWNRVVRSAVKQKGRPLMVDEARKARDGLGAWWRNRGYPRAFVQAGMTADSALAGRRLVYRVAPGSFARFGNLTIEGNETVSAAAIRKQVGMEPGDPYSEAAIKQSEQDLQLLDIVRVAHVDVPALAAADTTRAAVAAAESTTTAPADSVLPVRVHITEADRRLVGGDLGYVTDAGVTAEARWAHRNFSGGARSLTVTTLAQTGWLALTSDPDVRYRFAVSLKQPSVLNRRTSAVFTPFIEHRDDNQDLSTEYGINTTLVYQIQRLSSVSLDYQLSRRNIEEYRYGDLASGDIGLFTFLVQAAQGLLDSLGSHLVNSKFTLSGNFGSLDDPANPRRGVILRPAVQLTAPNSLSSTNYGRVDALATGFLPLGHSAVLAARARFGQLFPYGKSLPGPGDDPQTKFLQLHDASFTAGGTGDVRGWENRLLGPKVPDIRFTTVGDSLVPQGADGYDAFGGFVRTSFSLELRLPMRRFGPNLGSLLFLDGGRVWTNDARFNLEGDPQGQERLFVATGAGLSVRTPVGPIEVSVGYKLNPSVTDLADAEDVFRAARDGRPVEDVPLKNSRRWQWHLAIGASY